MIYVNTWEMLKRHEGLRLQAYQCTAGVWTIGYGHTKGVKPGDVCTIDQAEAWLFDDLMEAILIAQSLVDMTKLSHNRQAVIINMAFNLGKKKLNQFKKTLLAVSEGRWEDAAFGMLHSKWAGQVGYRADELAKLMREG